MICVNSLIVNNLIWYQSLGSPNGYNQSKKNVGYILFKMNKPKESSSGMDVVEYLTSEMEVKFNTHCQLVLSWKPITY